MTTLKERQHSVNALSHKETERMVGALMTLGLKERAKVCEPHRYAWTGTIPCTGIQRCTICGHRKE